MLKKLYLIVTLLTIVVLQAFSQSITNYSFVNSNGTFTALATPTNPALSGGTVDDGYYNNIPIGFDFWYMGIRYTTVSASTNGWITLGASIADDFYTNNLTSSGSRPLIAPLWDDLNIVNTSNVTSKTTGTAGSRVFTIQYLGMKWNYQASATSISFQVKLHESTGRVEFVYYSDAGATYLSSASIGLSAAGTGSGNFLSVTNAGTSVSSTIEANVTGKPGTGRTYTFTPPVPTAPTNLVFSGVTSTTSTLNWTDNSGNERGFVIYRSTDGTNYTFINQVAPGVTSSVQTGLTTNTTYYWRVYAVTEGGLSTSLAGTQISCVLPTLTATTTSTCVGGSTGTITGSASGGTTPYTYSINGGTYQASATFTGLAAATHTLSVRTNTGCITSIAVIVSPFATSTDNQNATGNNTWIGHMYDGTNFTNYIGQFTEAETFNEVFGAATNCFNVTSNSLTSSIYTETFSVKYRMASTKRGLYVVDLGSDDGSRLTVDGTMVCDWWTDHSYTDRPSVLMNLTGTSNLLYEFYENAADNRVVFQNLTRLLANTLSTNQTQSICLGNVGTAISGDVFGALPAGITLAGTGYQWSYSTTPGGSRTTISGATAATFTPNTATAPFNVAGTYYVYRTAQLNSANNVSPVPYSASNESNAATITITTPASATISYGASPFCKSGGTASVIRNGSIGGVYSGTAGLAIIPGSGDINLTTSTAGVHTVTYTIAASGGCPAFVATAPVTITAVPVATISYTGSPYCAGLGTGTVTRSGEAGGVYTAPTGLTIDAVTGAIDLALSTPGVYIVTYTLAGGAGCNSVATTTSVTVTTPNISQLPGTNLIAHYNFNGTANDVTGNNHGLLQNSPGSIEDRFDVPGNAFSFNGSSQYVSTTNSYANPTNFTISIWFKTNTLTGGKLIGFGNGQTGSSGSYDRHLYMNNAGQVYFGVYPGSVVTVNSPASYNDNNWHLATATLSSINGMTLYIDGVQVGFNNATKIAEGSTGYWKIGYDNLNGWTSSPSSFYFNGSLDDAVIYHRALTAAEVTTIFTSPDGAGNNSPVCSGSNITLTAKSVAGASYLWTGPNSFTSGSANPSFAFNSAAAGAYKLDVTLNGCTATAYTNVVASTVTGLWNGSVSTDWANANNWCSGTVPVSTTNVTIASSAVRMPVISSSVACNNLTIDAGASLTTLAAGTLNISGILTNNGTVTNSGTTNFNGTSGQQTFSGLSQFYNVIVSNTDGVLLPSTITINNTLTLAAGARLNSNNFNFIVRGDWINNSGATAFVAGSATVGFNGVKAQSIGGSFSTSFNNLTIIDTANTVSLLANIHIAGDLNINTGTFNLGTFTANRTSPGGALTMLNSATLKIGGTNSFPLNFATNTMVVNSIVEYAGTNQAVANHVYGELRLSSSSGAAIKTMPATPLSISGNFTSVKGVGTSVTFSALSAFSIAGNMSIGASTTFNGGTDSHSVWGNWTNLGTFNGNTSTITLIGTGTAVSGTGANNFNNLTIAAAGITFSGNTLTLTGNLATTGAGSFTQASGGTLIMSGTGKTISGLGIAIHNLTISGSVTTLISLNITGNLSVSGSFTASSGVVTMSGSSNTISGAGATIFSVLSASGSITTTTNFTIGSGLNVSGSLTASAGTVTFTGTSSLSGTANLFNATVNGIKLQLSANSTLGIASLLTISSGILDVTSTAPNTVNFNGTLPQNINGITYDKLILSKASTKTATSAITGNSDITISAGATFIAGAYTHTFYKDWVNNGTFIGAAGTIQFMGSATTNIIGATTFNILTINNAVSSTAIVLHNNVTVNTVNMIKGTLFTGANTLTITNTRTGTDIIYGTIQRTHTFTTGIAYAFEGPENTITFASLSGVNSVTVFVSKGVIGDFPFGGSISRVYNITVPAGTYDATVRLHYDDEELNGNSESSMGLWNYNGTWGSIGKTGNNSTSNYVEQTGLTSLSNRYTLSDNSNVVQWNGSVSTDWNTPANWTVLQGSASRPPSASDIVNLGNAAFNHHPTISSAVSVKNIVFGSVKPLTLSMAAGGSLITGDINGNWSANAIHTINVNDQMITINGDISLSNGTTGQAINLNIGSGTVTTSGSLIQSGGANVVFSGAGTLNIHDHFDYTNGTFTPGSGTVVYDGIVNQVVGPVTYNNITINKESGLASFENPLTIWGNLLVAKGELSNMALVRVVGNVAISSGGIFKNFDTIRVGGNWANAGTYASVGSSIYFDGTGTQTISPTIFNNLFINKPVGTSAILTGNMTLHGNLTIMSGTLDLQTFSCNRTVMGGVADLRDAATIIIGNLPPTNFTTYTLTPASTCILNGTGPQVLYLEGVATGNIIFRNAGSKTLITSMTVLGDLTIESGSNFDAGANTISINGNWINNGTFLPGTSTLLLTGTGKNISGMNTFHKMSISGSYTQLHNVSYNDLFEITPTGSISGGPGIFTTLHGDLLNRGILITYGTTTFSGLRLQTMSLIDATTFALIVNFNGSVSPLLNSTSAPEFGYLNINNSGGVNPSVGWTIKAGFTVGAGAIFNGGPSTHYMIGSVTNNGTITSNGRMRFTPTTPVAIDLGNDFSSTGTVEFGGTGAITLSGTPKALSNVIISNSHLTGITPVTNWTAGNNFTINSNSIFNAGAYTYTVGGNFLNSGTLNPGSSTFVLNGAANQDVNSPAPLNNLTINKTGGAAMLVTDVTVNGSLNFLSGNINTGNRFVIQPATGSVAGASQATGWVNGKMKKSVATGNSSKSFEIGDSIAYTPVALTFSNVTTTGVLTILTTPGDHADLSSSPVNGSKSVNRYWNLLNNGVVFNDYAATFNFQSGDVDAGSNTANFKVANHNGSSWSLPVTGSSDPTSTSATGLTTFDHFVIGEICNYNTTILYSASSYCSNGGTALVTMTGTTGGVFSANAGLSINPITGEVNLALSTPGTYSITYTIAATSACPSYITSTPITITAAPAASIAYSGSPYCAGAGFAAVTFTGTTGGVYSSSAGLIIDPVTGQINLATSNAGTYTVTYTIAASGGCNQYTVSAPVNITPMPAATISYTAPSFCANSGIVPVTMTGTAGGTYSATGGLSVNSATGTITLASGTPGFYTITYTVAAAGGCSVYTTSTGFTVLAVPSVTGSASFTCVGGSTGVITAVGSGGTAPYMYSINAGSYQSSAVFLNLAAGNYTLNVRDNSGCIAATSVIVSPFPNSGDNQNATATDSWIGHVYQGRTFTNYIGSYSETETFNQSFGGATNCFTVYSNAAPRTIYTQDFAVKYLMSSSKRGLYTAALGSDDGTRLTVDGSLIYNLWTEHSINNAQGVVMNLTGSSSLVYEYYENTGGNQVLFQSLTPLLANTLNTNTSQTICVGSTGVSISGDNFGVLPVGISLSGTGYQWSYSTTPGGARTNIAGATSAAYTPSAGLAPFNVAGTYYIHRSVAVSSANNSGINPMIATNVSDAAIITVNPLPSAIISYPGNPFCAASANATVSFSGTPGGVYSAAPGLVINAAKGDVNLEASTPGTYTVTYTVASAGGCAVYTTTTSITINAAPTAVGSYAGTPFCQKNQTVYPSGSGTGGGTFSSTPGLVIHPTQGGINLLTSTPGSYTVTYTIAATGGCPSFSWTAPVVINPAPAATISYPASPYCAGAGIVTVSRTGTTGGTYSASGGLIINAATGAVDISANAAGTYTVTYTVAAAGGCTQYQTSTNLSIVTAGTWTGAVSTDWNNSANWLCGAIPTSSINALLAGGLPNYPVITGTTSVRDISIATGASLTVNGTIAIAGLISNAGVFDVTAGTVNLNGASPQEIPSNAFTKNTILNLTINNNVTIAGQDTVTGTLLIESSNRTLTTGDMLTLKSTASGTARVAPLPVDGAGVATSFINGKVGVERYIPNRRAWRLLTAPLFNTGSIYNAWQNGGIQAAGRGMFVTGPAPSVANGLDASAQNSVSLKSYSLTTQNFVNINNTKLTNLSNNSGNADNIGYFAFVRGDRNSRNFNLSHSNNTTLTSKGTLQTGMQAFPAATKIGQFSLMGNPYASPVDFNQIHRAGIMKRFYVWDPALNQVGGYVVLDDLDGNGIFSKSYPSSMLDNHIQSGQAFFVVTDTAGPASLTYFESSKSATVRNAGFRPVDEVSSFDATLQLLEADGSTGVADAVLAEFHENFSDAVNLQDAAKFGNVNETFSLWRYGSQLAIERRPVIKNTDTLFFRLSKTTQRAYQFVIRMNNFNPSLVAMLEDKFTGTSTPLQISGSTSVNFTVTSNTASVSSDRFKVVFRQASVLPVTYREVHAREAGNNIEVNWKVENQVNIRSYEVERSTDGANFANVHSQIANNNSTGNYNWLDKQPATGDNYYRIKNVDRDGSFAYSKIVKVNRVVAAGEISVYPNPVTDGIIRLHLKNMAEGNYTVRLLNVAGQVLLVKEIENTGGSITTPIIIPNELAKGMYRLEVLQPGTPATTINVLNQ